MRKKRPHQKSRNGCDACRLRRVKCDEVSPVCGSCAVRDDVCHFTRPNKTLTKSKRASSAPHHLHNEDSHDKCIQQYSDGKMAVASGGFLVPSSPHRDLSELFLLHHWHTKAYSVTAHEYAHISKDHTIHESLQHTYLLDIVLALASIHLASSMQDATVAHRHIKTALQYQNRSVLGLRVALGQISERNLSAVLLASVLNLICALTSPLFPTSYDNSPTPSTVDVMQSGIAHFGGIGFVMNTYRDSINKGPLAAIFCEPSPLSPSDDMASCLEDIRLLHKRLCAKMLSQNDDLLLSLVAASQNLEIVCLKSNGRSMFSWIATVDMDFFHAVNRQHDAAVALFMAWGVLMYRLDESWWAKHVGKTIVQELSAKTRSWCGQEDLIEVAQWCREQVGIENCSTNEIAVC